MRRRRLARRRRRRRRVRRTRAGCGRGRGRGGGTGPRSRGVPQRPPATDRRARRGRGDGVSECGRAHARNPGTTRRRARRGCRPGCSRLLRRTDRGRLRGGTGSRRRGMRTGRGRGGARSCDRGRGLRRRRRGRGHAADDIRGEIGCARTLRALSGRPRSRLSGAIPRRPIPGRSIGWHRARRCGAGRRAIRRGPVRGRARSDAFALDQHRPDRRHLRRPPYPRDVAGQPPDHVPGSRLGRFTGSDDTRQAARRQRRQGRSRWRCCRLVRRTVHRPPVPPPPRRLHAGCGDGSRPHRFRSAQRPSYVGRVRGRGGEPGRTHRDAADRRGARTGQRRAGPAEPARDHLAEAHPATAVTTFADSVITHLLTNP